MSLSVSKWSRRYVLVSVFAFVCWQTGILFGVPKRTEIVLGVFGFVLHMIFGKAYALVPSYFESELAFPRAPTVQFPLVVVGTAGLTLTTLGVAPAWLPAASVVLWGLGVAVFVGTLLSTIGSSLLRGETGTGEHNADRRSVDRLANLFVPVALGYLLAGSYETAAVYDVFPPLLDGLAAQASHLLAAGTAALLVFALGFRLLPRFLVVPSSDWGVRTVLPLAAAGPALLAAGIGDRSLLMLGAILEATAVCLFAIVFFRMVLRSDRRRVGFYGVSAGMASGVCGVLLGVFFAFRVAPTPLATLHFRFNVLGFLGLTIVGLAYQFYPPSIGTLPGSSDRAAGVSILGIGLGLAFQTAAAFGGIDGLATIGAVSAFLGSTVYAYLVVGVFLTRT